MGFIEAVTTCLSKYATFSGRAIRSEYWYWMLAVMLASWVAMFLDAMVFGVNAFDPDPSGIGVLNLLFSLAVLLPGLAVTVRRLHDVDRSGWWVLIVFTIVGMLVLLYWMVIRGTVGDNRFGPDALAGAPALR